MYLLSDTLGKSPEIKILDHFLLHEDFAYTKSEIAEYAVVSRATVYEKLPSLLEKEILIETKKIGKITLYKLNLENPTVKKLRSLNFQIAKAMAERAKMRKEKAVKSARTVSA
jgi:DNA-binding transcriptional ArsR family regulator